MKAPHLSFSGTIHPQPPCRLGHLCRRRRCHTRRSIGDPYHRGRKRRGRVPPTVGHLTIIDPETNFPRGHHRSSPPREQTPSRSEREHAQHTRNEAWACDSLVLARVSVPVFLWRQSLHVTAGLSGFFLGARRGRCPRSVPGVKKRIRREVRDQSDLYDRRNKGYSGVTPYLQS